MSWLFCLLQRALAQVEHQGPDQALCMQAAAEGDDVEDSGAEDGVYLFRPHTSYISGLR